MPFNVVVIKLYDRSVIFLTLFKSDRKFTLYGAVFSGKERRAVRFPRTNRTASLSVNKHVQRRTSRSHSRIPTGQWYGTAYEERYLLQCKEMGMLSRPSTRNVASGGSHEGRSAGGLFQAAGRQVLRHSEVRGQVCQSQALFRTSKR